MYTRYFQMDLGWWLHLGRWLHFKRASHFHQSKESPQCGPSVQVQTETDCGNKLILASKDLVVTV